MVIEPLQSLITRIKACMLSDRISDKAIAAIKLRDNGGRVDDFSKDHVGKNRVQRVAGFAAGLLQIINPSLKSQRIQILRKGHQA